MTLSCCAFVNRLAHDFFARYQRSDYSSDLCQTRQTQQRFTFYHHFDDCFFRSWNIDDRNLLPVSPSICQNLLFSIVLHLMRNTCSKLIMTISINAIDKKSVDSEIASAFQHICPLCYSISIYLPLSLSLFLSQLLDDPLSPAPLSPSSPLTSSSFLFFSQYAFFSALFSLAFH